MYCKLCGEEITSFELLIVDGVVQGPVCREGYECYPERKVTRRIPAPAFGKMVMVHKIAARYVAS
jgi:hypothetical protein